MCTFFAKNSCIIILSDNDKKKCPNIDNVDVFNCKTEKDLILKLDSIEVIDQNKDKDVAKSASPLHSAYIKLLQTNKTPAQGLVQDPEFLEKYVFNNEDIKSKIIGANNLLSILLEQKVKQNVSKHTSKTF